MSRLPFVPQGKKPRPTNSGGAVLRRDDMRWEIVRFSSAAFR